MSVSSSQRRSSSIRKSAVGSTPSSSRQTENGRVQKVLRFQLPHSDRVRVILQDFVNGFNEREYEQLVCAVRDDILHDDELLSLLEEASRCVSILTHDLRHFVEALLVIDWLRRTPPIIKKYQSFLINLMSAHNYHCKFAIDQLVLKFIPENEKDEWPNGVPNDEDCKKLAHVHSVINILLKIIPMSRDILQESLVTIFPYHKRPTHVFEFYLHNLFWILDYQPSLKMAVLQLVFNKLIILDVNAPREDVLRVERLTDHDNPEEMFDMEDCDDPTTTDGMNHEIAHTLDVCMDKLFNLMMIECYDFESMQLNWDKTKTFYQCVLAVFDAVVLPTYNLHHVPFLMFFLCSFKTTLCEGFLAHLWKKVRDPNVAPVHRVTAVTYIASMLARGAFVPVTLLKHVIQELSTWIHTYVHTQDGLECVNSDVRVHVVFYSVCQALFYVIAFRHRDLVNTRKNIAFLENLNLAKVVTCRLNPLKACHAAVVQNFAAVTRTYQLAYCYSIIEHNSRNLLPTIYMDDKGTITMSTQVTDSFFPFDPYLLKRSGKKIQPIYLEYKDSDDQKETANEREEDDDFLEVTPDHHKSKRRKFSYGTSPGFKYKF